MRYVPAEPGGDPEGQGGCVWVQPGGQEDSLPPGDTVFPVVMQ